MNTLASWHATAQTIRASVEELHQQSHSSPFAILVSMLHTMMEHLETSTKQTIHYDQFNALFHLLSSTLDSSTKYPIELIKLLHVCLKQVIEHKSLNMEKCIHTFTHLSKQYLSYLLVNKEESLICSHLTSVLEFLLPKYSKIVMDTIIVTIFQWQPLSQRKSLFQILLHSFQSLKMTPLHSFLQSILKFNPQLLHDFFSINSTCIQFTNWLLSFVTCTDTLELNSVIFQYLIHLFEYWHKNVDNHFEQIKQKQPQIIPSLIAKLLSMDSFSNFKHMDALVWYTKLIQLPLFSSDLFTVFVLLMKNVYYLQQNYYELLDKCTVESIHHLLFKMNSTQIEQCIDLINTQYLNTISTVNHSALDTLFSITMQFYYLYGNTCLEKMELLKIVQKLDQFYSVLYSSQDAMLYSHLLKCMERTFGSLIQLLGPQLYLKHFPISLPKQQRTWLLPIMKEYISKTYLQQFITQWIPLAQQCYAKRNEQVMFKNWYIQIWSLLPGFCTDALDMDKAWNESFATLLHSKLMENTSEEEEEIHLSIQKSILLALRKIKISTFMDTLFLPCLFAMYQQFQQQEEEEEEEHLQVDIAQTIQHILQYMDQEQVVEDYLKRILKEFLTHQQSIAWLDLIIILIPSLKHKHNSKLIETCYKVIQPCMAQDKNKRLQKKAYKCCVSIVSTATANASLCKLILVDMKQSIGVLVPSAKKYRFKVYQQLMECFPCQGNALFDSQHVLHDSLPNLIGELILSVKEMNSKVKELAMNLLLELVSNITFENSKDYLQSQHLIVHEDYCQHFVKQYLIAGLGGTTMAFVSSSIVILKQVTKYFASFLEPLLPQLLQSIITLLQFPKDKEILIACLEYIKTVIVLMNQEFLMKQEFIASIVKCLCHLVKDQTNNLGEARNKIKLLFVKCIKKFGYDSIKAYIPMDMSNYMKNIRRECNVDKKKQQKKKQTNQQESNQVDWEEKNDSDEEDSEDDSKIDPIDLMEMNTTHLKKRLINEEEQVHYDKSGKLIVEQDGKKRKRNAMDEDERDDFVEEAEEQQQQEEEEEESKKKFSKKQKITNLKSIKKEYRNVNFGLQYRNRVHAGHDVMRRGQSQPHAYLPIKWVNKKKKSNKQSVFEKFATLTKRK